MIDFGRACRDFPYYAANLLRIATKDRQVQLFSSWWPSQVRVWQRILTKLQQNLPVRLIVLKARQMGASTLAEALLFWQVHTRPNTRALILSQDRDSSGVIFDMARTFYENLPAEFRPMKRYSNRKELLFANPDEKTRHDNPGLRSKIEVHTAGNYTPPRGANFHLVHYSEVGFWGNTADEIIPAINPMVPSLPGTAIIYESTANGYDNFFFKEWERAKNGESVFEPLFTPWTIMPEYSFPFPNDTLRNEFKESLEEEELELIALHEVTLEQLQWRRFKIRELGNDSDIFRQEFPATEQEAFIYSGYPIFNRKVLQRLRPKEPVWVGDINLSTESLIQDSTGLLDIYETPSVDGDYVIGVDTSSGTAEDYSCMCVLKRTFPKGLASQVAEWHGRCDPVELGQFACILARYFNNAMLSIEINNHGLTTQAEAQRHYWNFYRWQYFDRLSSKSYSTKVGWETNMSTKPLLIDRAVASLRDDLVEINSAGLIDEMWKYVRVPGTTSYEAEAGHDDRVMAFLIALTTLYVDDPNAHFVAGQPQDDIRIEIYKEPHLGDNVVVPRPMIDSTDPRGGYVATRDTPHWGKL